MLFLIFVFSTLLNIAYCDMENHGGDIDIRELNGEALFVSLGSYCAPASLVRSCGYRKAAFPFDWNITMDGEKLIEMLENDFAYFFDDEYLMPFARGSALLHTYYHIEFVHEGVWDVDQYAPNMEILRSKYLRRIERFRQLKNYPGKVFFLRSAYIYSVEDSHRAYKFKENIEISDKQSLKLYDSLKRFFPNLDFSLLVINNHELDSVVEEKRLSDNLIKFRAPL